MLLLRNRHPSPLVLLTPHPSLHLGRRPLSLLPRLVRLHPARQPNRRQRMPRNLPRELVRGSRHPRYLLPLSWMMFE